MTEGAHSDPPETVNRRKRSALFGRKTPSLSLGLLIFGFGTAAGFLTAFMGLGVLQDATGIVLLLFLTVLMFIGAFGLLLVLFRKPLLRRLFGFAETQIELFAEPLTSVAKSAVNRDPEGATAAARDLVHLTLARYAWISTRRWIIGSLTALIAAMAALAGTMLLFQQNDLLEAQNARIDQQIFQIEEQTRLNQYTVQLAEAARNAELVVEITGIAQQLGLAVDRAMARAGDAEAQAGTRTMDGSLPVLDPLQDLNLGLIMRIASASQATKPYQFLDVGITPNDQEALNFAAIQRHRNTLPKTYAALQRFAGLPDPDDRIRITDRPASPERGQLLFSLMQSGIRDMELLSFRGLDLSYAYAPEIKLFLTSFQIARLAYADFSHADINGADFGGAWLTNARFRKARIYNTSFSSVAGADIKPPFSTDIDIYNTTIGGADFGEAFLSNVGFAGVHGLALNFDKATLLAPDFTFAEIGTATFRGAALIDPVFTNADLRSVDFDGAVVIGADFLETVTAAASPGSFRADRYEIDEINITQAMEVKSLFLAVDAEALLDMAGNRGFYRIRRVQPFEN